MLHITLLHNDGSVNRTKIHPDKVARLATHWAREGVNFVRGWYYTTAELRARS